jgi:hypothetical protein
MRREQPRHVAKPITRRLRTPIGVYSLIHKAVFAPRGSCCASYSETPRFFNFANGFCQRVNLHQCEERFAALVGAFDWMLICDLIDRWRVTAACEWNAHRADDQGGHASRADQASTRTRRMLN